MAEWKLKIAGGPTPADPPPPSPQGPGRSTLCCQIASAVACRCCSGSPTSTRRGAGYRVLGVAGGAIKSTARMAVADPNVAPYPADHRQSFRVLGLTLLINLTEHNAKSRAVALEDFVARGPGGGDFLSTLSRQRLLCADWGTAHRGLCAALVLHAFVSRRGGAFLVHCRWHDRAATCVRFVVELREAHLTLA